MKFIIPRIRMMEIPSIFRSLPFFIMLGMIFGQNRLNPVFLKEKDRILKANGIRGYLPLVSILGQRKDG